MKPYFERNGIKIYHGDCRDVVPTLGGFDLLLTDPPYGIGRARKGSASRRAVATDYGVSDWDDAPPDSKTMGLIRGAGCYQIIFGGNYFELPASSCWLVWDKDNGDCDFADCELAWTNLDMAVRKLRWRWQGVLQERRERRIHPTQKPLGVMKWCIQQAPPECKTILDPFAGSCTTARAAMDLGINCVCIEREERYCEAGARRLEQQVLEFVDA